MPASASASSASEAALRTERVVAAAPGAVFAAIARPESLCRWWGPDGFRTTFHVFEFRPGGRWSHTMHGPDGKDYPNESVFEEILPDAKVVIRHSSQPLFTLTISLSACEGGTKVTWVQRFDDAETARRLSPICIPANEQNLDRLEAVLAESE
jgi:uncharacterized protein YndB with AHSA1/START domain